ncbi:MAG: membrane protein insertion efficiency factor YidD [Oscillospiraceae bacterium]|nr:membrane protein insertion efficiency factor YidD [Oscillospiraceae bacterium]
MKSYREQKRLEVYQSNRILVKPKTTKNTVVVYLTALLVIVFLCAIGLLAVSPLQIWVNILVLLVCIIVVSETLGRISLIKIVECYQHYATEETRRKCKCVPSCSEYAILCLKKYELIYALLKIRKRLFVTCKGFDYIIDNP